MAIVASSISELGQGTTDGQKAFIQLNEDRVRLRWNAIKQKWISAPRLTFTLRDQWIVVPGNSGGPNYWSYLFHPDAAAGQIGQDSFAWNPRVIRHADQYFAAGFTLQEHLVTDFWTWDPGVAYNLATVLYPFNDGEGIDGFISPNDYLGTQVSATITLRRFASSGWVNSSVQNTISKKLVTITIASPATVSLPYSLAANTAFYLTTTGALPTGLTPGTTYYVVAPSADSFWIAATPNGTAINTTGTQSGTHTLVQTVPKNDIAPHLYVAHPGADTRAALEYILCRHRWIG